MALSKVDSLRSSALLKTAGQASARSWAIWEDTLPPWAWKNAAGEGVITNAGRWKLEIYAGTILTYVNSVHSGNLNTGTYILEGALALYSQSVSPYVSAVLTRLA